MTPRWLMPSGRSGQLKMTVYAGLLALVLWWFAPVAVAYSAWALRQTQGERGRWRAWFGIIGGLLGTVFFVWYLAAMGS